jgi:hypothetical protein
MTEAEWLASSDVRPMFRRWRQGMSQRQWLLWAVGCCRHSGDRLSGAGREVAADAERYLGGGGVPKPDLNALRPVVMRVVRVPNPDAAAHAAILRCVVGNPYRPVSVDPSWLTPTILALARGIHADRAFDRMPILADALQDAGCEDNDILGHYRSDGPRW